MLHNIKEGKGVRVGAVQLNIFSLRLRYKYKQIGRSSTYLLKMKGGVMC